MNESSWALDDKKLHIKITKNPLHSFLNKIRDRGGNNSESEPHKMKRCKAKN